MATDTDLPAQQAHTASFSSGNASPGVDDWTQPQRPTEIVKTVTTTVTTTVPASTIEKYPEVGPELTIRRYDRLCRNWLRGR